jgi:hypothetical protein
MPIITLTSDLGDSSHYPAVLKGVMYARAPKATIVDVTHNVPNFDTMSAAYILRSVYGAYPAGTVHVLAVDPDSTAQVAGIVVRHANQYFVAPDSGVMSLISEGRHTACVEIQNESLLNHNYPKSFRAARMFAPVAAFLASGGNMNEVGHAAQMRDLKWGEPTYSGSSLRGKIIHIDKFGNAVTNIRKEDFMRIKNERGFEIILRNVRLKRIVSTYADVAKGDAVAIFNASQHLEVAMREQNAAELFGLKVHDMITIEFKGVSAAESQAGSSLLQSIADFIGG